MFRFSGRETRYSGVMRNSPTEHPGFFESSARLNSAISADREIGTLNLGSKSKLFKQLVGHADGRETVSETEGKMNMNNYEKSLGGRENYFPTQYKKDATNDCVVRAIAIATGLDYMKVWNDLFDLGREIGHLPNNKKCYEAYLETLGWEKFSPVKVNNKKVQVRNFPAKSNTSYIVHTTSHVTAIVNRVHLDSWNCGKWCANSYYMKKQQGVKNG